MKKLLTLFIVMVYGVASVGATLHLHYCCGKLDKISFSKAHNKNCPKKEGVYKRCCDSKQVDLKIKADQATGMKGMVIHPDIGCTFPPALFQFREPFQMALSNVFATGPPVHGASVPLFIKNCVFRI